MYEDSNSNSNARPHCRPWCFLFFYAVFTYAIVKNGIYSTVVFAAEETLIDVRVICAVDAPATSVLMPLGMVGRQWVG